MKIREYFLENMNCPSCALKIENEIKNFECVEDANVDLFGQRIVVKSEKDIFQDMEEIVKSHEAEADLNRSKSEVKQGYLKDIIILIVYLSVLILSKIELFDFYHHFFSAFFIGIYLYTGKGVLRTAFRNIRKGYLYDENFLMSAATIGALLIGAYEEAAGVMLFYRIGELLEAKAVESSKNNILDTTNFVSGTAHRIEGENVEDIKPEGIKKGDVILVKPGEMLPVDGELLSAGCEFDQSSISGESLPVGLEPGEFVVSGSSPLSGSVKIKAVSDFSESTTSKILKLISDAPQNKSEREKFITKFSRYYTPTVVYLAGGIVFIPYLLQLFGFFNSSLVFSDYLYRGLVFLVISCPCALMLSVPLSFFANVGLAAKKGILVKGANFLENIKNCDYILFDKTGTLTEGKFSIKKTAVSDENYKESDILGVAASLESHSAHPIASAFANFDSGMTFDNVVEMPGMGIKGELNGDVYYIGNDKLLTNLSLDETLICRDNIFLCLYVIKNSKVLGRVMLSDTLRKDAAKTIEKLKKKGINPLIVSGDGEDIVAAVAAEIGVSEFYYSLLPDEKLGILKELQKNGYNVAAVGDGLNDTALLSYADVGIAMGQTASGLSVDIADIVLLGGKLDKVNELLDISKKTMRLSSENIIIALGIKIIIMIASVFGMASLWAAVFADVGAALLTVLNSLKVNLQSVKRTMGSIKS